MSVPHPPRPISSARNPRVRAAADLRSRRTRDATGLTLVDGVRELGRALGGGARVEDLFVDPHALDAGGSEVVSRAVASGANRVDVTASVLSRLAYGDRSEGVVATVHIPGLGLGSLALPDRPLVVVLEGLEKPGNLGAVLRSADGAGADAVVAADPRTDLFNPNAIRASLGTIFAMPLAAGPSDAVRAYLEGAGVRMLAARVDALLDYTEADLTGPLAIVLGSEAAGLTDAWRRPDVLPVRLPMLGLADSLNVATAAAVLLYEARRQRGDPGPAV